MRVLLGLLFLWLLGIAFSTSGRAQTASPAPSCPGGRETAALLMGNDPEAIQARAVRDRMERHFDWVGRRLPAPEARQLRELRSNALPHALCACAPDRMRDATVEGWMDTPLACLAMRFGWYTHLRISNNGPWVIFPRFRLGMSSLVAGEAPSIFEIDEQPVLLAKRPEQRAVAQAFNRYVEQASRSDRPLSEITLGMPPPNFRGTIERFYSVHKSDDRLISLTVVERLAPPFILTTASAARMMPAYTTINWNVARNRPLAPDDLFRADTDWRAVFRAFAQRHWPTEEGRRLFMRDLESLRGWELNRTSLEIRTPWNALPWISDEAAAACEEICAVKIDASLLLPHLRPDSPWRPRPPQSR